MVSTHLSHRSHRLLYTADAFSRLDESPDPAFYERDRLLPHLDARALETVERVVDTLVVEAAPAVLDLMASWDSHLPARLNPVRVVGLGLNERELQANQRLDARVVHDLNADPRLPFSNGTFDVVLCTVSVDYLTRPFEVFREVGRVLRRSGLFLVTFSNRMFPQKAVRVWREAAEAERFLLVEDFFADSGLFGRTSTFLEKGHPRPRDDRHADRAAFSDPVGAVWAERRSGPARKRPRPRAASHGARFTPPVGHRAERDHIRATGRCPRCNHRLVKWQVPNTPFTEWDCEHLYLCFNDECPYVLEGWAEMGRQGNRSMSYRLAWHPEAETWFPVPVPSLRALRESIVPGEYLEGKG